MVQIITNLRTKDQVHFFRGRMNCKTQWLSEVDPQLSQLLQTLSRIKIEQGPESKSLYVFELSSFEEKLESRVSYRHSSPSTFGGLLEMRIPIKFQQKF